jgi:hypothetical protein
MKYQRGFSDAGILLLIIFGVLFLCFVIIPGIGMWGNWSACHAKWDRANMVSVEWGPIQGCMVKLPDGRWLPEERIREFDIPK